MFRTACDPRPVFAGFDGVQSGAVLKCQSVTCFFICCLKVLNRGMFVPVVISWLIGLCSSKLCKFYFAAGL